MIIRTLLLLMLSYTTMAAMAQGGSDNKNLYESGKAFMYKGDYENAVLVLNRASKQDPDNLAIQEDLAYTYYLKKDYSNAIAISKKLLDHKKADASSYKMLGMCYKSIAEYKECEKLYKKALKQFPKSGVLYNEFGELYAMQSNLDEAIKYWEKGIEVDPNISTNYYNAARYYDNKNNLLWSVVYGELFLNLESLSDRTVVMKNIVTDNYKVLLATPGMFKGYEAQGSAFTKAVAGVLAKHLDLLNEGITPESLTTIRTRFILDWFNQYAAQYPFRLFDHQRQLLQEGLFDAYNQWLFTAAASPDAYETWVSAHAQENENFVKLQRSRVFKVPENQHYEH